jgi:hypothetical protein
MQVDDGLVREPPLNRTPTQIGLGMPTHSVAVAEAVPPSGDSKPEKPSNGLTMWSYRGVLHSRYANGGLRAARPEPDTPTSLQRES